MFGYSVVTGNIASFGGDLNRVTIVGHSAVDLLRRPKAAGTVPCGSVAIWRCEYVFDAGTRGIRIWCQDLWSQSFATGAGKRGFNVFKPGDLYEVLTLQLTQRLYLQQSGSRPLDIFCSYATESVVGAPVRISNYVPTVSYFDNSECLRLLQNKPVVSFTSWMTKPVVHLKRQITRWWKLSKNDGATILRSRRVPSTVPVSLLSRLLRGSEGMENSGSINPFVKGLFSGKQIATTVHPRNEETIVSAQQNVKPMRAPSTRRKGTIKRMPTVRESVDGDDAFQEKDDTLVGGTGAGGNGCIAGEFKAALDTLFETLDETQAWHVFCVNPNDSQMPNQLEGRSVKGQMRSFGFMEIAKRCANVFEVGMTPQEFCDRYKDALGSAGVVVAGDERAAVEQSKGAFGLGDGDIVLGTHKPMLLPSSEPMYNDENRSVASDDFDNRSRLTSHRDDSVSQFGSESYAPSRNMFQNTDKKVLLDKEALAGEIQEGETTEVLKESSARRSGLKRMDVRQAWREKLALNIIIWFICGCTVFVIAILGLLICPTQHVFSLSEMASHNFNNDPNKVYLSIVAAQHNRIVNVVPTQNMLKTYGGTLSDSIFPIQISALCNGVDGTVSPFVSMNTVNTSDTNAQYHNFQVRNMASQGKSAAIYNGMIYDVTNYVSSQRSLQGPPGFNAPGDTPTDFMDSSVIDLFKFKAGGDITKDLDNLGRFIGNDVLDRQRVCLRNIFLVGKVDNRDSPQCLFATYILLAISIMMVSVIGSSFWLPSTLVRLCRKILNILNTCIRKPNESLKKLKPPRRLLSFFESSCCWSWFSTPISTSTTTSTPPSVTSSLLPTSSNSGTVEKGLALVYIHDSISGLGIANVLPRLRQRKPKVRLYGHFVGGRCPTLILGYLVGGLQARFGHWVLKTISGETHKFYVDEDAKINYQGIPWEVMHKDFPGELV
ncbi:hypothetical protein K435DRAFT_857696 [Dendrothele bispora CBS 962.96]|uniref:Myosin motor domain-containing protein n=1 Tax=Dendrothele bispora (strain CBS 962.96) TaxID=1314807 RepID=A0A4S8M581_DENBC|nr:hypothetical protein K435DRAFT_857696 [Dendrothele bispora CBS 962.96]